MDRNNYNMESGWRPTEEGQMFEAVARTNDSKRVIARATANLSVTVGVAFRDLYGPEGIAEVERSIRNVCEQLADGFPE